MVGVGPFTRQPLEAYCVDGETFLLEIGRPVPYPSAEKKAVNSSSCRLGLEL